MAGLSDIANETLRQEIEQYVERPEEVARNVALFSRARPILQELAVAVIDGEHQAAGRLTRQALDEGVDALEVMDDGLIGGMGVVGIKFREAVEEHGAPLLGMSALLTTTMPNMGKTIEAFIDAGLRDEIKIMVGGAPVTQEFADDMGADGYGKDALACVALAKQLLGVAPD